MNKSIGHRNGLSLWIISAFCLALFAVAGQSGPEIRFGTPLTIGPDQFFFGSLTDICEDREGGFYVLDRTESTVHKFSREGTHLLSFGRKGQGPGDLSFPSRITLTPKGEIAVSEDMGQVNLFRTDGGFIRRITLPGRLDPAYVGENRFYAWIWRPEDRQQVLVDTNNAIVATFGSVAKDAFSASIPDSSGRRVMFNYSREEYSPGFVFRRSRSLSAVALTDRYHIRILDREGRIISEIKREVEPSPIAGPERAFFRRALEKIAAEKNWPGKVINDLMKDIPDSKVHFSDVFLNADYVFVFRIPADITDPRSLKPVDLFLTGGRFLGSLEFPEKPAAMSDSQAYFARSDDEGNITLIRRPFTVSPSSK